MYLELREKFVSDKVNSKVNKLINKVIDNLYTNNQKIARVYHNWINEIISRGIKIEIIEPSQDGNYYYDNQRQTCSFYSISSNPPVIGMLENECVDDKYLICFIHELVHAV